MTNPSQDDWKRLFREVTTLQNRKNHPNIVPLLASYTFEVNESGDYVKILHLLFPLAETDLADWMTKSQVPSDIEGLLKSERQEYLYRFMYALASGISYLHREIDGAITAHHDLKPRNILILNGELKIADFGNSHLRPILEGSATEGALGLGTYEYQPPEYWNQDGTRANVKHGRPFDVWAVGCIIIELSTLIMDDWQSGLVIQFRNERKKNSRQERKSPDSVQQESDFSFHNNLVTVNNWIDRLKNNNGSRQLNGVLSTAAEMINPVPKNRPYMWEVEMDLNELLKPYDTSIPKLESDSCTQPPYDRDSWNLYADHGLYYPLSDKWVSTETPLHRAGKKDNWTRSVRLWELGWPLNLPGPNNETPLDIMKKSKNHELRRLDEDVNLMIKAAKTGDVKEIQKFFHKGLSPLMRAVDGRSAFFEAITSFHLEMVEFLLKFKAKEQIMLLDQTKRKLPIHTAAEVGFTKALERILKIGQDVNVLAPLSKTPLYFAAESGHKDAVKLLLENKAQMLPPRLRVLNSSETPLHVATKNEDPVACDIVRLLLQAEDSQLCIERKNAWGMTPLLEAAHNGRFESCKVLIHHSASIHAVSSDYKNLLHFIAEKNAHDFLQQYLSEFLREDFALGSPDRTPLKIAKRCGHKKVVRLIKNRLRQF